MARQGTELEEEHTEVTLAGIVFLIQLLNFFKHSEPMHVLYQMCLTMKCHNPRPTNDTAKKLQTTDTHTTTKIQLRLKQPALSSKLDTEQNNDIIILGPNTIISKYMCTYM